MRIYQFSIYIPHHLVILNPSLFSLGLFSPNSFKVTSLCEGIIKRPTSLCPVMYHISIYSHYAIAIIFFIFFGFQRFFLKKAHFFGPDVFLSFVVDLCVCVCVCLYFIFNLWVEAVFFSTVLKQQPGKRHWSSVCKRNAFKRSGGFLTHKHKNKPG